MSEFVGAQPPTAVARFLDELIGPSKAEQLLAELRESGEEPEIVALEAGEQEQTLALLLGAAAAAMTSGANACANSLSRSSASSETSTR